MVSKGPAPRVQRKWTVKRTAKETGERWFDELVSFGIHLFRGGAAAAALKSACAPGPCEGTRVSQQPVRSLGQPPANRRVSDTGALRGQEHADSRSRRARRWVDYTYGRWVDCTVWAVGGLHSMGGGWTAQYGPWVDCTVWAVVGRLDYRMGMAVVGMGSGMGMGTGMGMGGGQHRHGHDDWTRARHRHHNTTTPQRHNATMQPPGLRALHRGRISLSPSLPHACAVELVRGDVKSHSRQHLASTIHHPPSTIHHPPSTIHHPPSTIHHPPSTIHHPPSTIHHPPSTIHHPPSHHDTLAAGCSLLAAPPRLHGESDACSLAWPPAACSLARAPSACSPPDLRSRPLPPPLPCPPTDSTRHTMQVHAQVALGAWFHHHAETSSSRPAFPRCCPAATTPFQLRLHVGYRAHSTTTTIIVAASCAFAAQREPAERVRTSVHRCMQTTSLGVTLPTSPAGLYASAQSSSVAPWLDLTCNHHAVQSTAIATLISSPDHPSPFASEYPTPPCPTRPPTCRAFLSSMALPYAAKPNSSYTLVGAAANTFVDPFASEPDEHDEPTARCSSHHAYLSQCHPSAVQSWPLPSSKTALPGLLSCDRPHANKPPSDVIVPARSRVSTSLSTAMMHHAHRAVELVLCVVVVATMAVVVYSSVSTLPAAPPMENGNAAFLLLPAEERGCGCTSVRPFGHGLLPLCQISRALYQGGGSFTLMARFVEVP
ncbi:hypothetical protein PMIN01_07869 [Paraphaeosphaeria minitans]|uniref:Uncharacterized protein n=1 Tax=Paraphaeosphaeria minitans TaxID=565426 RepID=A0A9P6KP86_9PLEO|nr:hypothetical protein PMIN01_07869 [Paraphaeosphaeria minitans]